jgi:light-regulated signal transduction histidine kinase (bacteriophytochrome)
VGLALGALLVRLALRPFTGSGAPYLTFFLATATSAWQGGLWPGVISLVLGGLFSLYLADDTAWNQVMDPSDPSGLLRYLVGGAFVCGICQALINSRDRAQAAERRLLENEELLRSQAVALKRSNNDLEQFAFVASHDMQEPLRMINIYSELLVRKAGEANAEGLRIYLDPIRNGVGRMENLIRDLLRYSQVIHGDAEVTVVDANAAVKRAAEAVRAAAEEAAAEIVIGELPRVRAAESPLTQVFQNLLSNAIKYRNDRVPPVIRISARVDDGIAEFEVSDNGIGFEPHLASKIFGLFTRLEGARFEGTGLGLAICKSVVERYGGMIWAESEAGAGAKFLFRLPAASESAGVETHER